MPSRQDMEFAKLVAAKNVISKIELQKYLDEVDELVRSGRQVTLKELLCEQKVISREQQLKALQEKMIYCECSAQYHVKEEDVGTRFKCKKCGKMIAVPGNEQLSAFAKSDDTLDKSEISAKQPAENMENIPESDETTAESGQVIYDYDFSEDPMGEMENAFDPDLEKLESAAQEDSAIAEEIPATKAKTFQDCEIPEKFTSVPLELFLAINREAPVENVSEWWAQKKGKRT